MKYVEKAIENHAKAMQKYYARLLKKEIARFSQRMEEFTADGICCGKVLCDECPILLARAAGVDIDFPCDLTAQEKMKIISMEVAQ